MIRTKKGPRMDRSATPKRRRQYVKRGRGSAPMSRGIVRLDTPNYQTMAAHIGRPGVAPGAFIAGSTGLEVMAALLVSAMRRRRGRG